jgi:DNA-directed RNA polymerase subunit RPC12/RpoP
MTDGTDEPPGTADEPDEADEATPEPADGSGSAAGDDGETDPDLAARVAALERTVEALRETVERQGRDISYLAAAAGIESVEPVCPDCGEGVLQTSSGLTWRQVRCPECGLKRYL